MCREAQLRTVDPASCDLIVEFSAQAEVSDSTRIKYRAHLLAFLSWLAALMRPVAPEGLLVSASAADVQRFMAHLRAKGSVDRLGETGLSASTRKNYLASLRSFYRFCVVVGLVDVDPSVGVRTPRVVTTPGLHLTGEELRRLLDAPGTARERIQTYLMVYTAARSAELRGLRWGDIDFPGRTMVLRGKGGRQRTIDIHPALMSEIRRWFVHQEAQAETSEAIRLARSDPALDFVLVTRTGRPVQATTIYRQLKRRACIVGLYALKPGRHEPRSLVSPHALRRSFATQLLNKGHPIDAVADVLGHASLDTTRRHYAFSDDARRRATIEAFTV